MTPHEISLQVTIDKTLPRQLSESVVALGDFEPSPDVIVYATNSDEPGESALQRFYRDLIFGRPLPLKIVARDITDLDEALILALFLDRRLAIEPATAAVVFACDLARFGPAGLAHVDRDFAEFISWARSYLEVSPEQSKVKHVVEWLQGYILEGRLPSGPVPELTTYQVLNVGTNGFVAAQVSAGTLVDTWTELYRQGYLRGVLFEQAVGDRRAVLAARKSLLVSLDLEKAAAVLNEAERAMGEPPGWIGDPLWLWGPEEGTLLLPTHILEVLVRV